MDGWITVSDDEVVAIWKDYFGVEHRIPPWFYADAGTPIDDRTGDDMEYVRTETKDDARHQALDRLDQLHKIFPPPILPQDEGRFPPPAKHFVDAAKGRDFDEPEDMPEPEGVPAECRCCYCWENP